MSHAVGEVVVAMGRTALRIVNAKAGTTVARKAANIPDLKIRLAYLGRPSAEGSCMVLRAFYRWLAARPALFRIASPDKIHKSNFRGLGRRVQHGNKR
jgi:hypothetical protein